MNISELKSKHVLILIVSYIMLLLCILFTPSCRLLNPNKQFKSSLMSLHADDVELVDILKRTIIANEKRFQKLEQANKQLQLRMMRLEREKSTP